MMRFGVFNSVFWSFSSVAAALVIFLLCITIPQGNGHIASVLGNAGDGKPTLSLNHVRLLRGPTVPPQVEEDPEDAAIRLQFLKSPSYQHKYLHRLSQFHGNGNNDRVGTGAGSYYSNDGLNFGAVGASADEGGNEFLDSESMPTYMPYIGPRALSNIPMFFEHLRANIEALQKEHGNPDQNADTHLSGAQENSSSENEESPIADFQDWLPRSSVGDGHLHHMRRFLQPGERNHYIHRANNYNPSWLYTNLGLGKRRR